MQALATLDDHVAMQRRQRDEARVGDAEPVGEVEILVADAVEGLLRVVDQIHLVHRDDDVRNAEQVGDVGVAAGLRQDALARVDEDDRQVCGRCRSHHVARVLLVARRVGDDVLARAGGEVACRW
ncbi:MAG: hypothetical protein AW12_02284 [Candidatus Accumulibacter sp. BA-94]|nr:MAG: hypothetical protein AW12_02284 [Candidatus Accumulibacter sp. BA-94]